ncbi:flagellar protein FliT [Gammaproteobacteria bacterium]
MSGESVEDDESLQAALNLTRKMRDAARAGEWETLAALEGTRRILFNRHFKSQPPGVVIPEENHPLRAIILEILDIDREVLALSVEARNEAATILSQIKAGKAAIRAYRRFRQ